MTFWEDLKNALISVTLTTDLLNSIAKTFKRATTPEEERELTDSEFLSQLADDSIRNKSELFSVIPNLLGMPILNDLYSPGYGMIVRRRVSSAYQANLLSPMEYIAHKVRYPEKPMDLRFFLSELGYNKDHEEILNDLYKFYPGAQDFVRFAVREVFKPQYVIDYRTDEEYPTEIKPYMAKAGLTDEVMRWYWRSHWELPSFYNIREARWRGVITDKEVEEWLKANDYAPYWREKIEKILYTPYTRVDVRRMYDTGVLLKHEVQRAYQNIGYDIPEAENLTKFTVINSDKTKDVLSTYTKAFKQGIINESELTAVMKDMEYSDKEIELRISMLSSIEVTERAKRGLTLTNVKKLFTKGLIDAATLEDMLINLNYSDEAVMYMKLLIISDSTPHKVWTAEIKKGYRLGLVTRDETISRLMSIGYTDEAISLTLAIIDSKKVLET